MSDLTKTSKRKGRRWVTNARLHFALPHFDDFLAWLKLRGYSKGVIAGYTTQFGHWTQWLNEAGFDIESIHDGYAASVASLEAEPYRSAKLRTGNLFITFLQERGVVDPLPKAPSAIETWSILGEYRKWMRRNRGVMDTSLDTYQTTLLDLMKMVAKPRVLQVLRLFEILSFGARTYMDAPRQN